MTELKLSGLSLCVPSESSGKSPLKWLVRQVSLNIRQGQLTVLLGPNGAGKTSLIRLAAGLRIPSSGEVLLDGSNLGHLSSTERARSLAYLPQIRPLVWPVRVKDLVALGRLARGASIDRLNSEDQAAVDRALQACDLTPLAERYAHTLSGGELARMHSARAFATEAKWLLADEPTSALDLYHQHRIMSLFKQFADSGAGVLLVLHDIVLATRYADRLIWMKEGEIVATGNVKETLTESRIAEVYGVRAQVLPDSGVVVHDISN